MTTIYHDEDADLAALAGATLAVVGYGNQGRSQALNLRDSGLRVIVGNIRDASFEQARRDGFDPVGIAEACRAADVVLLLTPDEVMPQVYADAVAPHLGAGDVLDFAHGYNIAFGLIAPPPEVDVVLVAPRMIGPGVRDTFVAGTGFPSVVGVHQDASGSARARMLAIAKGIGSTRAGCIEMSMLDEAALDLFTEQAFGPAFGRVMMTAIETLVDAGFPPEAVLLELYLSGELAYTFQKIRDVGLVNQMDFHSHTSQYGSLTRSARFADLDAPLRTKMQDVLEEIRSGRFAAEWSGAQAAGREMMERVRAIRSQLPVTQWEDRARAAFRIGDGAAAGPAAHAPVAHAPAAAHAPVAHSPATAGPPDAGKGTR
jgi:ketol-acid reductoisomerase